MISGQFLNRREYGENGRDIGRADVRTLGREHWLV